MEDTYYESSDKKSWVFNFKYPFLIVIVVLAIIAVSFGISFSSQKEKHISDPNYIYTTWKVEKLYRNGKLVLANEKYANLFLQVNKDGTAEWIKGKSRLKLNFKMTADGNQMVFDDGMRMEEIETVFELRPNVLRMGKRNINSYYEYVFTATNHD